MLPSGPPVLSSAFNTPVARRVALAVSAVGIVAALGVFLLNRRVDRALEGSATAIAERPVEWAPIPEGSPLPFWGSEDIDAVAVQPEAIYVAGAAGVARLDAAASGDVAFGAVDLATALPTRRASAFASWRRDVVVGLAQGGLYVRRDGAWLEARSGFGALHVRALAETVSGELWIGAREGLFRMRYAETTMARLHATSVRAVAIGDDGRVVSGGEAGLFATRGDVTTALKVDGAPTAWIDALAVLEGRVWAVTSTGLFAEQSNGVLRAVSEGADVVSIASVDGRIAAAVEPAERSVRWFEADGRARIETVPDAPRGVMAAGGRLIMDAASGLWQKSGSDWKRMTRRGNGSTLGQTHVGALAAYRGRLVVGFFDGGLAELVPTTAAAFPGAAPSFMLRALPTTATNANGPWAINALLDAGGALHIASLRGAWRLEGDRLTPLGEAAATFSLARTPSGVAIGRGDGVLLPEQKLLSGFQGLPGNQATALAATANGLLVGTPSGLGYVEGRSVRWRVASGDGALPHPWVTGILPTADGVLVATYGGGLTRRAGTMAEKGAWAAFAETAGLKINTGCLFTAAGRVYAGTDGQGLLRLSKDGSRFERLKLSLPSPRVTALAEMGGFLYIGTDEGLTRWPVDKDAQP